jgi:hypothetical protein
VSPSFGAAGTSLVEADVNQFLTADFGIQGFCMFVTGGVGGAGYSASLWEDNGTSSQAASTPFTTPINNLAGNLARAMCTPNIGTATYPIPADWYRYSVQVVSIGGANNPAIYGSWLAYKAPQ